MSMVLMGGLGPRLALLLGRMLLGAGGGKKTKEFG